MSVTRGNDWVRTRLTVSICVLACWALLPPARAACNAPGVGRYELVVGSSTQEPIYAAVGTSVTFKAVVEADNNDVNTQSYVYGYAFVCTNATLASGTKGYTNECILQYAWPDAGKKSVWLMASNPPYDYGSNDFCFLSNKFEDVYVLKVDVLQAETNVCWRMTNANLALNNSYWGNPDVPGATVDWSSSPAGLSPASGSGSNFTFNPSLSTPTTYVVTARASLLTNCLDTCTVRVLKVDVLQAETNVCWKMTNAVLNLTPSSYDGGGGFEWSSSPAGLSSSATGSGPTFSFDPSASTPTTYVVTAYSTLLTNCLDVCTVTVFKVDLDPDATNVCVGMAGDSTLNLINGSYWGTNGVVWSGTNGLKVSGVANDHLTFTPSNSTPTSYVVRAAINGFTNCFDTSTVVVLKVDLDIGTVAEGDEETVGGFVPVNADNDNGSTVTDHIPATRDFDADGYTDDDLVPISLSLQPTTGLSGMLRLRKVEGGRDRIKVWETTGKATEVPLPKTWTVGTNTIPATLYVEGLKEGQALRDIDLILEYLQGGAVICDDKVKVSVTPVLKKLDAVDSGTVPDLATDGSMYIHSNGGLEPGGVPAMEFELEVFDVNNPPGELRLIQHARLSNLLSGGACVIGHDGTTKKLDFVAPNTGGELVDSDATLFPFYDDLDSSAVTVTSEDTPSMWVAPLSLWPWDDGQVSQIDFKYNFRICAVWQYPDADGIVYFLGHADWSTRIQGQLQKTGGTRSFVGGASNDNVGSTGFTRVNTNLRTALPNATESVQYMDP